MMSPTQILIELMLTVEFNGGVVESEAGTSDSCAQLRRTCPTRYQAQAPGRLASQLRGSSGLQLAPSLQPAPVTH